jgi:hypothetical protein
MADAACRAAIQPPNRALTTLADGHLSSFNRSIAASPRRLACVRDQSYAEGNLPYLVSHSSIAAITSSLVHLGAIAPGRQRLQ